MINLEQLKSKLNEVINHKDSEAAISSAISINCKVPQELNGFLTDLLNLTSDEVEVLDALYKLDRKQITTLATLAMIANGRIVDFVNLERNMMVLKIATTLFIGEHTEYRTTSVDENGDSVDNTLKALTIMKQIVEQGIKSKQ